MKYLDLCDVKGFFSQAARSFGACEVDWMLAKYMGICVAKEFFFSIVMS